MAGSSLWLVPPPGSPLYKAIHSLIVNHIPATYPIAAPPRFTPHVTLTADTALADSEPVEPQLWLDTIDLPPKTANLKVAIGQLDVESPFFRKLTMRCGKTPELCELAAACRAARIGSENFEPAKLWVEENYRPHCSLMYSDASPEEVTLQLNKVIDKIKTVQKSSIDCLSAKGGEIWLVPTYKPIDEWKPVATRLLPDMEWLWDT